MSKPKQPPYTAVDADDQAYKLLAQVIKEHHPDLLDARIALVWANTLKPDRDGHVTWGTARKVGPLDGLFNANDFIITLNSTVWAELLASGRAAALLDHELCHCGVTFNDDGEPVFYIAKHDLEEFVAVVERHGLWRKSVEDMVNAAIKRKLDEARSGEAKAKVTA